MEVQSLRDSIADWFCTKDSVNWGKAALYRILNLIIDADTDKSGISIARLAYTLARMEPKFSQDSRAIEQYGNMRNCIFKHAVTETGRKMLVTAIQMAVYMTREKEDKDE